MNMSIQTKKMCVPGCSLAYMKAPDFISNGPKTFICILEFRLKVERITSKQSKHSKSPSAILENIIKRLYDITVHPPILNLYDFFRDAHVMASISWRKSIIFGNHLPWDLLWRLISILTFVWLHLFYRTPSQHVFALVVPFGSSCPPVTSTTKDFFVLVCLCMYFCKYATLASRYIKYVACMWLRTRIFLVLYIELQAIAWGTLSAAASKSNKNVWDWLSEFQTLIIQLRVSGQNSIQHIFLGMQTDDTE